MRLQIRFPQGSYIRHGTGKNRRLALATASLLIPAAVMAGALAVWRLAADLKLAADFAISGGPFSHWLVWLALAVALAIAAIKLNRYGRGGGETAG